MRLTLPCIGAWDMVRARFGTKSARCSGSEQWSLVATEGKMIAGG
jgi:hypothetical protein